MQRDICTTPTRAALAGGGVWQGDMGHRAVGAIKARSVRSVSDETVQANKSAGEIGKRQFHTLKEQGDRCTLKVERKTRGTE